MTYNFNPRFRNRVSEFAQHHHWDQRELAALTGINLKTLNRQWTGQRPITVRYLDKWLTPFDAEERAVLIAEWLADYLRPEVVRGVTLWATGSVRVLSWLSDAYMNCIYASPRWLAFTGQSEEQVKGYGWLSAIHPDDQDETTKTNVEAFKQRKNFVLRYRVRRHDGEYVMMYNAAIARHDKDGTFLGYIGFVFE